MATGHARDHVHPGLRQLALARHLDQGPVTGRRLTVWLLSASGIALDGFDLFVMSAAGPLITKDLGLSPAMAGLVVSAAVIGAIPGALLSGVLADRIGRRRMLQIDLFVFVATSVLCAVAWSPWVLVVFRLLQGAAIGAEYPLSASMVSEVMPRATRGKWVVGAFAFQAVGMVVAAVVSTSILLVDESVGAWRWMLLAGIVPALVVAVLRLRIPESPRWTAEQGDLDAAERDAEWLTGSIPVITREIEAAMSGAMTPPERGSLRELWSRPMLRLTLFVAVPWFLMDIALYAVGLFTPDLIASLSPGTSPDSFLSADLRATAASAFTDVFLVVGFVLNILLVERLGRIRLQVVGFVGMAVGLSILAASGGGSAATSVLPVLLGLCLFDLFVNSGPNATTYLLPAEVFPTRLRATGHGFAAAAGKCGAALGSFFLPDVISAWGVGAAMAALGLVSVVGAVVTYALRVETRGIALDAAPEPAPAR